MGRFLKLVEEFNPDTKGKPEKIGKFAVLDALEAAGISCNSGDGCTVTFSKDGHAFEVVINVAHEEEQESLASEDPADIEAAEAGRAMSIADKAVGSDPGVQRTKRELGTRVTNTMGQLSNKLGRLRI